MLLSLVTRMSLAVLVASSLVEPALANVSAPIATGRTAIAAARVLRLPWPAPEPEQCPATAASIEAESAPPVPQCGHRWEL